MLSPETGNEKIFVEEFSELKPLLEFNGEEVPFKWKDKEYIIASIREEKTAWWYMTFGVWEVQNGNKIPVGYCDAEYDLDTHHVIVGEKLHDLMSIQLPENFSGIDNLEMSQFENELGALDVDAFAMDIDYRKNGLSHVFLAETIVVFQAIGAKEITFRGDTTVDESDVKSTSGKPLYKSFYGKYSQNNRTSVDKGIMDEKPYTDYTTKISPTLSAIQEGLLIKAFNKY
jgi:hypothetical protein